MLLALFGLADDAAAQAGWKDLASGLFDNRCCSTGFRAKSKLSSDVVEGFNTKAKLPLLKNEWVSCLHPQYWSWKHERTDISDRPWHHVALVCG